MKTKKNFGLGAACLLALFSLWAAVFVRGQSAPVLKISITGSNQVTVNITNAVSTNLYEIFFSQNAALPLSNWQAIADGSVGQSSFVFDISKTQLGFFRALTGNDLDGDHIPNWQDARPLDTNYGTLTITIESPGSGANVN